MARRADARAGNARPEPGSSNRGQSGGRPRLKGHRRSSEARHAPRNSPSRRHCERARFSRALPRRGLALPDGMSSLRSCFDDSGPRSPGGDRRSRSGGPVRIARCGRCIGSVCMRRFSRRRKRSESVRGKRAFLSSSSGLMTWSPRGAPSSTLSLSLTSRDLRIASASFSFAPQ